MIFTRWYDRDKNLKLIVETLEYIDANTKLELADDIIQIIIDGIGISSDELIDKLDKDYVPGGKRWYDSVDKLYSAVEMLKYTDELQRTEIIKEIMYSVLYFKNIDISGKNHV
ncbi:MAG: hypothetical protein PHV68_01695 [Candidatus Gastranaerophilales bacterium]|nr:hypothetical protein [Candidatus Gastranaerophilales bacterium]